MDVRLSSGFVTLEKKGIVIFLVSGVVGVRKVELGRLEILDGCLKFGEVG